MRSECTPRAYVWHLSLWQGALGLLLLRTCVCFNIWLTSSAAQATMDEDFGEGAEEGFQGAFKTQRHVTDALAWAAVTAPALSARPASASQPASRVLLF